SQRLSIDSTQIREFSLDEQLKWVYLRAKQADIIPADLELARLQGMFAMYRKNVEALRHYQPSVYPGRFTLYTTRPSNGNQQVDRSRGWQAFAAQELDVHTVPGNHYSMLRKPNLYHLVDLLKERLEGIE